MWLETQPHSIRLGNREKEKKRKELLNAHTTLQEYYLQYLFESVPSTGNCSFFITMGQDGIESPLLKNASRFFFPPLSFPFPSCMSPHLRLPPPSPERKERRKRNQWLLRLFFSKGGIPSAPRPPFLGGFLFHARGGGGGEIWKKSLPGHNGPRHAEVEPLNTNKRRRRQTWPPFSYVHRSQTLFFSRRSKRGLSFHPFKRVFGK